MSPTKCAVCSKDGGKFCSACKSCYYCSKECQKNDWVTYKKLCSAIVTQSSRPTPFHVRGIYFPEKETVPKLVWIRYGGSDEMPEETGPPDYDRIRELVAKDTEGFVRMYLINSHNLNKPSSRNVEVHYRDQFCYDDDPMWGLPPMEWQGNINNVTIIREDGQDLIISDIAFMDVFCEEFAVYVKEAMEVGTRAAKMKAMASLTAENYRSKMMSYR
ncbi:hypothetical protein GGR52DRAFT_570991 [Hypoxylon sp. FL1284]|nr:hypothetical protein GGR52DRAFT_570991 [Hypoxylon sp. FL1284]